MVASFLLVVIKTGVDWPQLLKGVFFFYIPGDREGITIVLGQLGAAVGVNMTFLYPYTLLARGWGKEHRRLKNFDLATSMFLPFVLATSLVIIACANTLYVQGIRVQGAVDAAHTLQPLVGLSFGRLISDLLLIDLFHSTLKCDMCRKVL
jgi:Mn2+/Fe2+ NRAMP family transporter